MGQKNYLGNEVQAEQRRCAERSRFDRKVYPARVLTIRKNWTRCENGLATSVKPERGLVRPSQHRMLMFPCSYDSRVQLTCVQHSIRLTSRFSVRNWGLFSGLALDSRCSILEPVADDGTITQSSMAHANRAR